MTNLTNDEVYKMCEGYMKQYPAPGTERISFDVRNSGVRIECSVNFEGIRGIGLLVNEGEINIQVKDGSGFVTKKNQYKYATVKQLFERLQQFYRIDENTLILLTQYHTWTYLKNRVEKDTETCLRTIFIESMIDNYTKEIFSGFTLQETDRDALVQRLTQAIINQIQSEITLVDSEASYFNGGSSEQAKKELENHGTTSAAGFTAMHIAANEEKVAAQELKRREELVRKQRANAAETKEASDALQFITEKERDWIKKVILQIHGNYKDRCLRIADMEKLKNAVHTSVEKEIRKNIKTPNVIQSELDLWRALDTLVETI